MHVQCTLQQHLNYFLSDIEVMIQVSLQSHFESLYSLFLPNMERKTVPQFRPTDREGPLSLFLGSFPCL